MNDEAIKRANYGYDLDGGGYSFEEAPPTLGGAVIVWTDPDLDYLGLSDVMPGRDFYGLSCPVFAFAPNSGHFRPYDFRRTYKDGDDTYVRICHGDFTETDRECHCHGKWGPDGWEATGDTSDDPHPECERCEGDGYVVSPGGEWAIYALEEEDDGDELMRSLDQDTAEAIANDNAWTEE